MRDAETQDENGGEMKIKGFLSFILEEIQEFIDLKSCKYIPFFPLFPFNFHILEPISQFARLGKYLGFDKKFQNTYINIF